MHVFATPRLLLRHFTTEDAAFIYELVNTPAWKQYIGDLGIDSVDAARGYIETTLLGLYRRHGFGFYAMERASDGEFVGMCGLIKREALDDVDLGFALLEQFAGQGLAHEAAAATLAYARDTLGLARVGAITHPDNARSARLLERLGMRYERLVQLAADAQPLRFYAVSLTDDTTHEV